MNDSHRSEPNLNVLERILNGMDAYIYVTDPDTDEILFINDKMSEHFDFNGGDGAGVKCWAVLQSGMTGRCPFCPNYQLRNNPEKTVVWEEHNTVTKRHYRNSDKLIRWTDGRLVHMQHSVDITEMSEIAAAQQELMSRISQSFISGNDVEEMVTAALKKVGEFMDYARVLFSSFSAQTDELVVTHEWLADGIESKSDSISIPFKRGEYLYDCIASGNTPVISRDAAAISAHYNAGEIGVKSFLSMPIFLKEKLLGLLEFHVTTDNHLWESNDIHLAEFLCGAIAGILDRKQTETNFIRMSTLIERFMQPVVYIDTNETVVYYNAATYKVFGYTEDELSAGGLEMLFGKETYERVRTQIWPTAFAEGIIEVELPLIHKNGNVRIFSFLGVVINIKNELPQLATIGTDITDLVDAKEAAEAVSKAKTEFLARMSHEIRTPMNAIIGMTTIAQESDDPARKKYCLEKISSASNHLLGVINDILDMSKIEANKFEISTAEFNFEKMLINITNMVGFRVDEKSHNFVVNFDPAIPSYIISDEQRLAQVIVNLLSNAVKFTPERGTIALDVRCIPADSEDIKLQFTVSDTGIGIAPEQQSKLFGSFEQADGSISRRFGGTGLGLAISKRIVELLGGQIGIESELGKGTKVIFDVFVGKGAQKEPADISKKIDQENLRILAVDDSSATRDYFLHLMAQLGIWCDVAQSGAEALDLIEQAAASGTPYNFFFVDWMMPELNGIELAALIKERMPANAVIIMISAAHWSDIERDATAVGIDGFIPKPLFPSALVDCINGSVGTMTDKDKKRVSEQSHPDFSGYRLLLVEDVAINCEIVMALLEDTKIQIDIAENGVEAVKKFGAHSEEYDLIFMDIHMPIMDGYEATREIRAGAQAAAKQIPIIAMTANAFKEDVERCKASGMNDHVSKPIDRSMMLDKMKIWLKPRNIAG
jgi:PAS domain S-box